MRELLKHSVFVVFELIYCLLFKDAVRSYWSTVIFFLLPWRRSTKFAQITTWNKFLKNRTTVFLNLRHLEKKQFRRVVGAITGHCGLNKHLNIMSVLNILDVVLWSPTKFFSILFICREIFQSDDFTAE